MKHFWRSVVMMLFGIVAISEAQAQFSAEPLVLNPSEWQYFSQAVSDGQGGVYYVTRAGYGGVSTRIQRIDPFGETVFSMTRGPETFSTFSTDANPDGVVCAVAGDDDPQGVLFWIGPSGIQREETTISGLSSSVVDDPRVVVLPDEYGSPTAAVLYKDLRDDMLLVQKKQGIHDMWGQSGYGLASASGVVEYAMIGDGVGGVIVAWTTTVDTEVHMERISATGAALWNLTGPPPLDIYSPCTIEGLVTDGDQGAWVLVRAVDSSDGHAYFQGVDRYGAYREPYMGSWVPTDAGYPFIDEACLASDGAGGFWAGLYVDVDHLAVVKHMRASLGWSEATIKGQGSGSVYGNLALVQEPSGGAFLAWDDYRSDSVDGTPPGLYGVMIDDVCGLRWREDGLRIGGNVMSGNPQLVAGLESGCYVMYKTPSGYGGSEYVLQSVDPAGYYGATPFALDSVQDVPGDQGGQLIVAWQPSFLENVAPADLERYTVWRLLDLAAGKSLAEDLPGAVITDPAQAPASPAADTVVWTEKTADKTTYWELAATAEPLQRPAYAALVASLSDSTAVYPADEHFRVVAHAVNGIDTWTSNEVVGHSVDNLAPAMPAALAAAMDWNTGSASLDWQPNSEDDLLEYRIYRGLGGEFEPDPAHLLATVLDPGFVDDETDGSASYKLAAVDVHGNVSAFALLAPTGVSGVDLPLSSVSGVTAVAPNPFNPSTTVSFRLATAGPATIEVYDMSGRLIRTLANEEFSQGEHSVTWDGRADDGTTAASGMYFLRMQAGSQVDGRKAMLLK